MEEKKVVPPQSAAIPAVVIFFVLLFVFAKWGPAINFSSTTQSKGEPFIVTGEGKVSVTPDVANITLGIQENGSSLKTVQNAVNTKSKTLTDAIKKLGVEEKDIKTSAYNVYPQYDYSSNVQRITGYQVSTNYIVTVKDFDKVNDIVVAATAAGANVVGSISFDLNESTKTEKMNEARVEAVKEAKAKAEGLAKAAGITLGRVINVSENQNQNIVRPVYAEKLSIDSAGSGVPVAQPDIQPGQTELNVAVSLSYEVR
jgi:uncharacterized protein YggE